MNTAKVTAVGIATAAAMMGLVATAHADPNRQKFASPSGSIRCVLDNTSPNHAGPIALCQISDITYVVPAGLPKDELTGGPCPAETARGRDFRLDVGNRGFIRCTNSALDSGVGPWPTLDYGQTSSLGAITCDSEPSGVTCTDTGSGHFFRVSRESYGHGVMTL